MSKILLYFDTVSPWSKVAFERLPALAKQWGAEMSYHPVNLGMIMKFSGNRPPVSVPAKGKWMFQDMARAAKFYDVTLKTPSNFPVNTMHAQSFLRMLQQRGHPESVFISSAKAFFDAIWGEEKKDVATKEDLVSILSPLGIFKAEELETLADDAMKKETRATTQQEAQKLVEEPGVFGMPWIVVTRSDGKRADFFGSDRLEHIAAFLGKEYKGPFGDGRQIKL